MSVIPVDLAGVTRYVAGFSTMLGYWFEYPQRFAERFHLDKRWDMITPTKPVPNHHHLERDICKSIQIVNNRRLRSRSGHGGPPPRPQS